MKTIKVESKRCACNGSCSGYATRSDCPPLIVLAVAALAQTQSQPQ